MEYGNNYAGVNRNRGEATGATNLEEHFGTSDAFDVLGQQGGVDGDALHLLEEEEDRDYV